MDTIDGHVVFLFVALGASYGRGFVVTGFLRLCWPLGLFLAALIGAVRKPAESIGARIRRFGQLRSVLPLHPGCMDRC